MLLFKRPIINIEFESQNILEYRRESLEKSGNFVQVYIEERAVVKLNQSNSCIY